jgi:hypothetical protein
MDLTLSLTQRELQGRASSLVRDVIQPREAEFEHAGGRVPRAWGTPIRGAAITEDAAASHTRFPWATAVRDRATGPHVLDGEK